jgi:hypothetical protein
MLPAGTPGYLPGLQGGLFGHNSRLQGPLPMKK